MSEYSIENLDKSLGAKQHRLKKIIYKLPEDFMTGAGVQDLLAKWVKEMESVKAVIEDVDKLYDKLLTIVNDELDLYDNKQPKCAGSIPYKPWWCKELSEMYWDVRKREREYL